MPMLRHGPISNRRRIRPLLRASRIFILAGRVLLFLTGILLLAMPWTEHYCAFDRFLRGGGGQDVELGLFAILSFLCMVLVLAQHLRRKLAMLLAILQSVSSGLDDSIRAALTSLAQDGPRPESSTYPPLLRYNAPLRI